MKMGDLHVLKSGDSIVLNSGDSVGFTVFVARRCGAQTSLVSTLACHEPRPA